jgi:hypothetical protein
MELIISLPSSIRMIMLYKAIRPVIHYSRVLYMDEPLDTSIPLGRLDMILLAVSNAYLDGMWMRPADLLNLRRQCYLHTQMTSWYS